MIEALLFDGRSARPRRVRVAAAGGDLVATPDDGAPPQRWPLAGVHWPETPQRGRRVVHLPDGATLEAADAAAFDAWRREIGHAEGWTTGLHRSWRGALVAMALLVVVLAAGYHWGVPLAARGVVALLPPSADEAVGQAAWSAVSGRWLRPSVISAERQQALRTRFDAAVQATLPPGRRPAYTLRFHAADPRLGPNAFALPGGTIVVTDGMVELLADRPDTMIGVLGHELGHVQRRHGMRALVQVALLGTVTSLMFGDFSTLLAGAPALVGQLGYSRDAEREADTDAVAMLRAAGHAPDAMVVLFERLRERRGEPELMPTALASHPADAERIAFFRAAAAAGRR